MLDVHAVSPGDIITVIFYHPISHVQLFLVGLVLTIFRFLYLVEVVLHRTKQQESALLISRGFGFCSRRQLIVKTWHLAAVSFWAADAIA